MPTPTDPFTAAHQAIFAALQDYAPLAALVARGNFINTTDPNFVQFKPNVQSSDTPQIKILQEAFTLPPFGGNSTSVQFTQVYKVMFCTDVLRVVPLNQLKYQTLIALIKAGPTLGLSTVKSFTADSGRDDWKSPESERSQRWTAALSVTVHFYLNRQQLAAG